jgi:hypothetical protein
MTTCCSRVFPVPVRPFWVAHICLPVTGPFTAVRRLALLRIGLHHNVFLLRCALPVAVAASQPVGMLSPPRHIRLPVTGPFSVVWRLAFGVALFPGAPRWSGNVPGSVRIPPAATANESRQRIQAAHSFVALIQRGVQLSPDRQWRCHEYRYHCH